MPKSTLNNKEFLKILKQCCKDGKLNDKMFNNILCNYFPYDIIFKGDGE